MFDVTVDYKELRDFAKRIGPVHQDILARSLDREAYRLHNVMRSYARQHGARTWGPYAPITRALRKKRGLGPWAGSFLRYHTDRKNLTSQIGVLTHTDVQDPKFKPISKQFAASYQALASGYSFFQSRKRQRAQFAALRKKGKIGYTSVADPVQLFGTKTNAKRYGVIVPAVGWHKVKARPIVDPVAHKERQRTIHNVIRLYKDSIAGLSTRGWINRWGGGSKYVA